MVVIVIRFNHSVFTTSVLFSLTYDDVRLVGASAAICCEVALNLVSSLIEQVQVVFHWVSIMKALARTDDTWRRKKRGMLDTLCGIQSLL